MVGTGGEVGEVDLGGMGLGRLGSSIAKGQGFSPSSLPGPGGPDRPGLDSSLVEQGVAEVLVGRLGGQAVVGVAAHRIGNLGLMGGIQQDRDETGGDAAGVVDLLGDDRSFPVHPLTLAGHLVTAKAPVVGRGADQQDPVGLVQAIQHPTGPALGGGAVDVAIEDGLDAVLAQALRQGQDPLPMGVGVVAVADEDPHCAHAWRPLVLVIGSVASVPRMVRGGLGRTAGLLELVLRDQEQPRRGRSLL